MKTSKKLFYFIFSIILVFSLIGCQNSVDQLQVDDFNEINQNYDEQAQNVSEISTGEIPNDSSPRQGGTLRLSMRIPKTLNPLMNEDVTIDNVLKLVFEPLFKVDKTGKLISNIAESYSITNDIVTIKVKNGLKWHNGSSITAKDVIFSLNLIKAQGEKSLYKNVLNNISAYIENGNVITIKLTKPYYYSIYNLCFPVISSDYYNGKTALETPESMKPMGSGCFKFSSYQLANELILEKCQGINGTPYIDKVSVLITEDRQTDFYAFEQAITDVINSNIDEWGKYSANKKVNITEFDTNDFEFLGYNFKKPSMASLNIRQAISSCIPTSEIFESVYLNHGTKTNVPVNPNYWYYAKDSVQQDNYNLENAKNIIAKTGYKKEQLTFSILVNVENKSRCEVATIIANKLNQIGFNITVNKQPFDVYQSMIVADNFDMFIGGVKLSNSCELAPLLSSQAITSGVNYFNYSNKQMDELITKVETAPNDEKFKEAQQELQKYIEREIPFTGICFKYSAVLTSDNVNGEKNPTLNNIYNDIHKWYISN